MKARKDYRTCDYCLQHKRWVSLPKPVYYRYGFAKCLVSIYGDCDKYEHERLKVNPITITVPTKINAFESICKVIKRLCKISPINYYEAVKLTYSESEEVREYLGSDVTDIRQIDKNLKLLWPFTYRIVNEYQEMIQVIDRNPDNLTIKWIPDVLTPKERVELSIGK